MLYRAVLACAALVAGAACTSSSSMIANELREYGFDAQQSQCMGDRLEANLSMSQLQQLGRAARAADSADTTPGRVTSEDFLRAASTIDDVKVPIEVAKAASGCGVLAGMIGR